MRLLLLHVGERIERLRLRLLLFRDSIAAVLGCQLGVHLLLGHTLRTKGRLRTALLLLCLWLARKAWCLPWCGNCLGYRSGRLWCR